jgi:hypothetical protein
MRKYILIAGFVLASAAAQAGDRSLSLAGGETTATTAPAKVADGPRTAELPQAVEAPRVEAPSTEPSRAEAPKYIERPAVVEPKAEAPKAAAPKTATPNAATVEAEQPTAEPAKPAARKTASTSKSEKPRRKRYWTEARIIRELNRHGIYW